MTIMQYLWKLYTVRTEIYVVEPVQGSEAFLQVQLFRSQFFLQPHTANSLRFFGASIKSPRNGLRTSSWKFVNIAQKYNITMYTLMTQIFHALE